MGSSTNSPLRWRRAGALLVLLGLVIVVLDQIAKVVAVETLDDGPVPIIGETIRFALVRNSGAAFSLGTDATPVFTVLATVVVLGLLWYSRRVTESWWALGLGLILGGAAGNLVDRLVRAPGFLHGHVIDYVAVGWFPVFNIADAALTVGVVVIAFAVLFGRDPYPMETSELLPEGEGAPGEVDSDHVKGGRADG